MTPKVSVIIANYNGRPFVQAAVESALSQTLTDLEVIIVDNCSTDGCYEFVKGMTFDKRLRVFRTKVNSGGPSVPRNRAIQEARGKWIAVMDNDDMMHPNRLRTLVDRAEADGADIVADDLRIFDDHRDAFTARCLADDKAFWVDPVNYVRSNMFYGDQKPLGLLKPLIRSDWLVKTQYRAKLHMAEDYDLIIRLLLQGARMKVYPDQMYFYRKHDASISHRLTKAKLLPTLHYNDVMIKEHQMTPALADALRARHNDILTAIAFDDLVVAIKARQVAKAIRIGLRHPRAAKLLRYPLSARARKLGAPLLNMFHSNPNWRAL